MSTTPIDVKRLERDIADILEAHPDWGRIRIERELERRGIYYASTWQVTQAQKRLRLAAAGSSREDDSCNANLRKEIQRLKIERDIAQSALEDARRIERTVFVRQPPPHHRTQREYIRVFLPDLHGSVCAPDAVAACLADLKMLDPAVVVLLGDILECGGFLAQKWTLGYVAETEYTFEQDVAAGNQFLDRLQEILPRAEIHYLEGNHEHRVEEWCVTQALKNGTDAEWLRQQVGPEKVLDLENRGIRYYRRDRFYDNIPIQGTIRLGTPEVPCYATHGIGAPRNAAKLHIERFGMNVVFGHTHRMESQTINTVHHPTIAAHSPGCLCQRQRLWNHTRPDSWQHGYGVQTVLPSGMFQHLNVLIVNGRSLLMPMMDGGGPTQVDQAA